MKRTPRIGIALGSGSARGWAHIGVLRALARAGIEPQIIAGCSIGAFVGAVAAAAGGGAKSPDDVIAAHCGACHTPGVLGAPKIGDAAAWKTRADAKGGVDGLLKSAIAGINAMPPKGTCATCSDDELKGAIKKLSGL